MRLWLLCLALEPVVEVADKTDASFVTISVHGLLKLIKARPTADEINFNLCGQSFWLGVSS